MNEMNATLLDKLSIPLSVSFVLLSDNCVNLENDTSDENRSLQLPCQVFFHLYIYIIFFKMQKTKTYSNKNRQTSEPTQFSL